MTSFRVILDDLGIETASATLISDSRVLFSDNRNKSQQYGAIGVTPISTQSTTSGTLKGAAWGLILAGPLGVAIGSMVGGGMKVAFEIETLEGVVLKCIAGRGAFLRIKTQVEKRPAKPRKKKPGVTGPRNVSPLLIVGLLVLPLVFFWFLLRPGHTPRARLMGLVWLGGWLIGLGMMSEPPGPPAGPPVVSDGATPSSAN